ncbi:nitrile hydratase subunit alpha [Epibacterium ulvae]|uniref:nitrile hydratase subunit alpha n=1 Tax=Epibacterium ulvae TaxID=1156985 RepID=UPI001BFC251E|nr:nitrile hydratase subunit alpha [Epibacterium ulvae]MBT8154082.1 nitrile hydratase subunit alpha [Epibacterium ulvae]
MPHDHDHDDHSHSHAPPEDIVVRVKALENLMIKKGFVDPAAVDEIVEHYERRIGPHIGAKVVARAWANPAYKARLVSDANAALAELDVSRLQGEDIVVVENTDKIHNVLVCTLCSCYPWNLLGLPPVWYKSTPYRSRIVKEPRVVLKEDFDLPVADDVEVRVWDANAELRYMVLPQRPEGTDGLSEEELEKLVTRDSMIGTGQPARLTK